MKKTTHDYYSDLFKRHVLSPSREIKENKFVVSPVLTSKIQHASATEETRGFGAFKYIEDAVKGTSNSRLPAHLIN
ncbi:hypothetical protein KIN20_020501 [Parelaphostrongylus tenuis]|uniref:Uncharacterized protein n=1 Tax=Parelaphostrongylus tenuis TaxID=148309 RepID=A0AAD5QTJ2_PARTN|nr:hypothetical protein KIN20_020501 [Parelaphostrongylus tenuis]